jgi:uncharacterized SAM-binding protein YcdF (DUF218 family)
MVMAADPNRYATGRGAPAAAERRMPTRRSAWLRAGTAVALTGAVVLLAGYVRFAAALVEREPDAPPRTDAIVVVTGGAQRIGDAIGLLGAERGSRLLISGVNEKTSREELAQLNPSGRALIGCCVDLDYRARNTIGNAIESRRWQRRHRFRSLLVVTSNYHMPRTLLEFAHAMPEVRVVGHPVVTDQVDIGGWWHDPRTIRLLGLEYAKYLAAWARSLVEGDPETSRLSIIIGGRKPVSPKPGEAQAPPGAPAPEPRRHGA